MNAIDKAGGPVAVARICGVSQPSVTNWRRRGVPIERCVQIERATNGAVMRWDLRPDDWAAIWPELAERADAPKPAAKEVA
jgi:DNA-binding transcriptional regulator YdaS (Cro superfamily)